MDAGSRGEDARAPSRRDGLAIAMGALALRLGVVAWAAETIPPAADGTYYQRIAERISAGLGYTWLWPDGAVTYAAHYPVGYPAMVGAIYAVTGARPWAAMTLNALLGAISVWAVHRLVARAGSRAGAGIAAGLVALHPGLVAYTAALMTEGVTASLVACCAALAAWARDRLEIKGFWGRVAVMGVVVGIATLVRPQSIVLAPMLGALAALSGERSASGEGSARSAWKSGLKRVITAAAVASIAALAVCAPWTARNCVRMKRCALVSVNGGWNLLIGADEASTGAWSPVKVPIACREVFDEAEKDACFGREAQRWIREHPSAWLALAPKKLAATFDYAGAAPWYLHEANRSAFSYETKVRLGALETIYERVVLLLALLWTARDRAGGGRPARDATRWSRVVVAIVGAVFVFMLHAWIAYAAFAVASLLKGRALFRGPVIGSAAVIVTVATMATHAAFFGAGRYSMVVFPLVCGVAALAVSGRGAWPRATSRRPR